MQDQMSHQRVRRAATAGRFAEPIDATDRKILAELVRDARISVRSLAGRLHLSRATAYARIDRLTREGIIDGFSARVVHERAGLTTTAYIAITIEQNTWRTVSDRLAQLDYIDNIALLGSDFDVLVQAHAPDNQALRTLVLERIQAIPGVKGTRTWLAFEEIRGTGAPWEHADA